MGATILGDVPDMGGAEAETILADLGAAGMLRAISVLASSEARAPRR